MTFVKSRKRLAVVSTLTVLMVAMAATLAFSVSGAVDAHRGGGYGGSFSGGVSESRLDRLVENGVITEEQSVEISTWYDARPDVLAEVKDRVNDLDSDEQTAIRDAVQLARTTQLADAIADDLGVSASTIVDTYTAVKAEVVSGDVSRRLFYTTVAERLGVDVTDLRVEIYRARISGELSSADARSSYYSILADMNVISAAELSEINSWTADQPEILAELRDGGFGMRQARFWTWLLPRRVGATATVARAKSRPSSNIPQAAPRVECSARGAYWFNDHSV